MTSSIGQGAWGNPKNAFIEFPREIMQGSTSGIGGHSSESHGRYPAGPSHEFIYKPGSYRFGRCIGVIILLVRGHGVKLS